MGARKPGKDTELDRSRATGVYSRGTNYSARTVVIWVYT
jgi:hypothetical protein